jgi:hypothetical protein
VTGRRLRGPILGLAVATWLSIVGAQAETITLACRSVGALPGHEAEIDQIIVDDREPSITARIARSVGTRNEVVFRFANSARDQDTLRLERRGDLIVAAGFRFGRPNALLIDLAAGSAIWSYVDGKQVRSFVYACDR